MGRDSDGMAWLGILLGEKRVRRGREELDNIAAMEGDGGRGENDAKMEDLILA